MPASQQHKAPWLPYTRTAPTLKAKGLPVLVALVTLAVSMSLLEQSSSQKTYAMSESIPAFPLISTGVPVYASSSRYPAKYANDTTYSTYWRSYGAPAWITYDLSQAKTTNGDPLGQVALVWYNDLTGDYDHTIKNMSGYNLPSTYTIDINAAPGAAQGATTPPSPTDPGWTTVASVTSEHYHSRQFVFSMQGQNGAQYHWVRMNITAIDGSTSNMDAALNMDVYDASQYTSPPFDNDFIFFGDSITRSSMSHATPAFAQLIANLAPGNFPIEEDGGIGYLKTADGVTYLPVWLPLFHGKYVALNYGTNDALACLSAATVFANFDTMVQEALNAGVIPIIPHIPWGSASNIQSCGPGVNTAIDQIYAKYSTQVIQGPDLWALFYGQTSWLNSDGIHPNSTGQSQYRQAYACTVAQAIYGYSGSCASPTPTPTSTSTSTPTPTSTPTSTPPPGGEYYLFTNGAAANGFSIYAYGYSSENPCDSSTFTSAPCSYAITYNGYGYVKFTPSGGSMSTSPYSTFTLDLFLNGQPASNFAVLSLTTTNSWIKQINLGASGVGTTDLGNGWTQFTIPVSQLNPSDVTLGAIQIKNALSASVNQINIDDIAFY